MKPITAVAHWSRKPPPETWKDTKGVRCWTVHLKLDGRRMSVPFFQGSAHTEKPTAADVLTCLLSDANSVESARSFDEWAGDLGYDTDSRKAERTYRACQSIAKRLRVFLGDEYEALVYSDEDAITARCAVA